IILELLGTVLHADAGALADVLVIGTLIGILKSTPSAYIVDQDGREIDFVALNIINQLLQRIAPTEAQSTLSLVGVGSNNFQAPSGCVLPDRVGLILGRVFLVIGRHADVLDRTPRAGSFCVAQSGPFETPMPDHRNRPLRD